MDNLKKKKYVSKVIKNDSGKAFENYSFSSFSEERELKEKIASLEKQLEIEKNKNKIEKSDYEKLMLQNEINFKEQNDKDKEDSFNKGFTQGKDEGLKEGEKSVINSYNYFVQCGKQVLDEKNDFINEAENQILNLVKILTNKIIGLEIETIPEVIISVLKKSLKLISDKSDLCVKVNKEELEFVKSHLDEINKEFEDIENLKIIADAKIEKGSVIIETNNGLIDGRISTQLNGLYEEMLKQNKF